MSAPPELVEIPVAAPLPESCKAKVVVTLPDGTTGQQVIEKLHAAILAYELQVDACTKDAAK